jgi:hypothetical protein
MSPRKKVVEEDTRPEPSRDEIALRAYEIHESEGGDEVQNWLRAEQEILDRYPVTA